MIAAVALGITVGAGGPDSRLRAQDPQGWLVNTWPGGIVHYRFATSGDDDWNENRAVIMEVDTRILVRTQMNVWEDALSRPNPADPGTKRSYIEFRDCMTSCPTSYVLLRMNGPGESNNMCTYFTDANNDGHREEHVGRNPNGPTHFHLRPGQDANTVRHELGHCLGMWHEQNRLDRDHYLIETPDADTIGDWEAFFNAPQRPVWLMPELGNYDYDSIMHYASGSGWTDARRNQFSRWRLDDSDNLVSPRDVSRVLQYYARDAMPQWDFFKALVRFPRDADGLPNPQPASGVTAVGTPAVAWQSADTYDVFTRGSNGSIYWRSYGPRNLGFGITHAWGSWTSLPCGQDCSFVTDPAAVSPAPGEIRLVAIDQRGQPKMKRYLDGVWGSWMNAGPSQLPDVIPATGPVIGPALTVRGAVLDLFVVLASGDLGVSSRVNGVWTAWTVFDRNLTISARPAAVAVSLTQVRLAINANGSSLYEPLVTFDATSRYPRAAFGTWQATTAYRAAPALALRANTAEAYRVLIVDSSGLLAHKFQGGGWWHIGGIPKQFTGVSAVGDGSLGAVIVMRGEDVHACSLTCLSNQPNPNGSVHNGAIWTRRFY